MHQYQIEGRDRTVAAFVVASVPLAWLIHMAFDTLGINPQWWVSVPSLAACYSVLYWLFDHYLWKLGLLRRLGLIMLPDLNGTWDGEVKSSYSKFGDPFPVCVTIVQRWSKMVVRLDTEHSRSQSTMASLKTIDLPHPELSYQYVNEPKPNAPDTMEMHRGTTTLELICCSLEGGYYTGRGRGELGTLKLRRR